jgi:hypothetical protein
MRTQSFGAIQKGLQVIVAMYSLESRTCMLSLEKRTADGNTKINIRRRNSALVNFLAISGQSQDFELGGIA